MGDKEHTELKHWKDLTLEEEMDYILWWEFFGNSIKSCLFLINKIEKPGKDHLETNMLWEDIFIRMDWIYDSIKNLSRYLGGGIGIKKEKVLSGGMRFQEEKELWETLADFRKYIEGTDINNVRNAIEHRRDTFKMCRRGEQKKVLISGMTYLYSIEDNFYKILDYKVNFDEMFKKTKQFHKDISNILEVEKHKVQYGGDTIKINMLHPLILNSF